MELRGRREKGVEGHMVKQMNLVSTNVMEGLYTNSTKLLKSVVTSGN